MLKIDILLKSTVIILVALAMSMLMPPALSQTGMCLISGTVTVNDVPMAGVTVSAPGAYQSSTTDSDGLYAIGVPANGQMIQVTATYNGISVTSDPIEAKLGGYSLPISITYEVSTPTPNPTNNTSSNETATPTVTPTPTPTATATPVPTQAPAAPAQNPQKIYVTVTVTVTPEPTESPNMTINDMLMISDISTTTPMPPSSTTTRSPGFAGVLALACLTGAAVAISIRKKR